jgi:iron complex transport system permease protein
MPRPTLLTGAGVTLVVALAALQLLMGDARWAVADVFAAFFSGTDSPAHKVLWLFRLPKAVTCMVAGSGLAVCGLLMQTLFRNPLAGPDVLGLSSGAALMVAVALLAGRLIPAFAQNLWTIATAASVGCLMVFLLMMAVAHRVQHAASLLIVGLMVAATTSSAVAILQFLSSADDLQAFIIWTMGSVGGTAWNEIGVMTGFVTAGLLIAVTQTKALNSWVLGETYARSIGTPLVRARILIMLATSLTAGAVTAFCGPISFVGLAVPHLVRLALPSMQHQKLLPIVALAGACLLLACDLLTQLPGPAHRLPLNAVTALIGAPVVIWVVVRSKKIIF